MDEIRKEYKASKKKMKYATEKLKQRVATIAAKLNRYQRPIDRFSQNKMFNNNQRQFHRELDQEWERCKDQKPDAEEKKKFSGCIWDLSVTQKKDARWFKDLKSVTEICKKEKIYINEEKLRNISRIPNYKSPASNLVQGIWLK